MYLFRLQFRHEIIWVVSGKISHSGVSGTGMVGVALFRIPVCMSGFRIPVCGGDTSGKMMAKRGQTIPPHQPALLLSHFKI
jgi:hypothetical protein